jgi:hypothetical protein
VTHFSHIFQTIPEAVGFSPRLKRMSDNSSGHDNINDRRRAKGERRDLREKALLQATSKN